MYILCRLSGNQSSECRVGTKTRSSWSFKLFRIVPGDSSNFGQNISSASSMHVKRINSKYIKEVWNNIYALCHSYEKLN